MIEQLLLRIFLREELIANLINYGMLFKLLFLLLFLEQKSMWELLIITVECTEEPKNGKPSLKHLQCG